jgi:FkbM family methyltransferase
MTVPHAFAQEYDLSALSLVTPRGCEFEMYVTPRYREHYERNQYEQFSACLLSSILRRTQLFLDIGASYGFYTLLARSRHPHLEIIAVEPTPKTCAVLNRNVDRIGRSKISVHEVAISDASGSRQFNVSLASDSCGFFQHPNVGTLESIVVATTTVDSLLRDYAPCPLMIKIDTEGNELAVLKGMTETLDRFPDIKLLVEFCPATLRSANVEPAELLSDLDQLGFTPFILDEKRQRFYLAKSADYLRWTNESYANLYCVRKERSLNLCFFSHSAQYEGAERVLLELVDDLIVDYDSVCSVILPSPGPLAAALGKAGAATIIAPYSWWCRPGAGHALTEAQKSHLIRESAKVVMACAVEDIRRADPDIVWSQTMVIPWGAMAAAHLKKPHVWYVTEFGERDHKLEFFAPLERISREIELGADLIYTCSKAVADELFPGNLEKRVQTLYCFPRTITNNERPAGPEQRFFKIPGAVRLGIFGSIQPQKGQEDIILAVGELVRRGRNVELLLAGNQIPEYRHHLDDIVIRHRLSEHIHFAGMLQDPSPAMDAAEIIVICSRCEAFGRTGVEAMMLGKPVIYPNTGGILEYMLEGQTGLSYTPGDISALVEGLEELIAEPSRRSTMGRFNQMHASKLFNKECFSGNVYQRLIELRTSDTSKVIIPGTIQSAVNSVTALPIGNGIRRNEPCLCGSGKRFKHCHGSY